MYCVLMSKCNISPALFIFLYWKANMDKDNENAALKPRTRYTFYKVKQSCDHNKERICAVSICLSNLQDKHTPILRYKTTPNKLKYDLTLCLLFLTR